MCSSHEPGLKILLICLTLLMIPPANADTAKIRLGVLAYGTVNWELDTVRYHSLAKNHGIELVVTKLSGKNASAIALQGGAVDAIVTDWIWVSRQRNAGADYSFVPHSVTVGGLMVSPKSGIKTLSDLRHLKLGIAGGPVDKNWLMLRAFAQKTVGIDLKDIVDPTFAAPPLLNKVMLRGDIPAVLNFWHYAARLEAAGMTRLVDVDDMLAALEIKRKPPLIGWIFSEKWAEENPQTITGFLQSLREAKKILATSDSEWERLRPLTKAEDDTMFIALRDAYRAGIPNSFNDDDIKAATQLYSTLVKYGGRDLVGENDKLASGTFWPGFRY